VKRYVLCFGIALLILCAPLMVLMPHGRAVSPSTITITTSLTGTPNPSFVEVDGTLFSNTPVSFLWIPGTIHTILAFPQIAGDAGTRFNFTEWTAPSFSSPTIQTTFIVNSSETITANYQAQYYLDVESYGGVATTLLPAATPSSGWFNSGAQVTLTAPPTTKDPANNVYDFHSWTVNGIPTGPSTLTISMLQPKTAIAWYVDPPTIIGDFLGQGKVTLQDLVLIVQSFGAKLGDPNYNYLYDINGAGVINLLDLAIVARAMQP